MLTMSLLPGIATGASVIGKKCDDTNTCETIDDPVSVYLFDAINNSAYGIWADNTLTITNLSGSVTVSSDSSADSGATAYAYAYGIWAKDTLTITNLSSSVTVSSDSSADSGATAYAYAYGIWAQKDLTILTLSGSVTASSDSISNSSDYANAYAYGIYSKETLSIIDLSGSVSASADSSSNSSSNSKGYANAYAYGIYSKETLSIIDLSGSVSAQANSDAGDGSSPTADAIAYGIFAVEDLSIATLSASVMASADTYSESNNANSYASATARAYGMYMKGLTIATLSGSVTASANADSSGEAPGMVDASSYGIDAYNGGVTITTLSGSVTASANADSSSETYGTATATSHAIVTGGMQGIQGITIATLSGSVTASANASGSTNGTAQATSYAIASAGAVTITTLSGSVTATATKKASNTSTDSYSKAYGIYADYGSLKIADLSGTVSATADDFAVAISSDGTMNLIISGTVEASAAEAYAIRSGTGTSSAWSDSDSADSVTLLDGAIIIGQIDLGGGADSLTIAGTVTINGEIILGTGDDTLTLSGTTLDLSEIIQGGNGSDTLVLTGDEDATLSGTLTSFETLTKSGTSTWTLASDLDLGSSSGTASITDGTLSVNSTLTADSLTVDSGGTLAGTGTVAADVTNNGTVSPGNSPGTLTIDGDYVQTDSGTLVIQDGDLLKISGTASLAGTFSLASGSYYSTGTYTFLDADSAVSGAFDSISTAGSPFLDVTLDYDSNAVNYTLTRASYTIVANNRNAYAAAAALSTIAASDPSSTDLQSVIGTVDFLSASQAATLMNQLHPEPYDALLQNGLGTLRLFARAGTQAAMGCAQKDPQDGAHSHVWNQSCGEERQAWLVPLLSRSHWDGSAGVAGYDATTAGFAVGMRLPDLGALHWQAQLGYARTDIDYDSSALDGEADTWLAGLFAQVNAGPRYLHASLQTGWSATQLDRRLDLGSSSRVAEGTPEQFLFAAGVTAGQAFDLSPTVQLAPEASLDYAFVHADAFSESGADSLDLLVDGDQVQSLRSTLGVKARFAGPSHRGLDQHAEVGLGWIHEFANDSRLIDAAFRGAPEYAFTARTEARPENALGLSVAWHYPLGKRSALSFDYQGELAHDDQQHAFSAQVSMQF